MLKRRKDSKDFVWFICFVYTYYVYIVTVLCSDLQKTLKKTQLIRHYLREDSFILRNLNEEKKCYERICFVSSSYYTYSLSFYLLYYSFLMNKSAFYSLNRIESIHRKLELDPLPNKGTPKPKDQKESLHPLKLKRKDLHIWLWFKLIYQNMAHIRNYIRSIFNISPPYICCKDFVGKANDPKGLTKQFKASEGVYCIYIIHCSVLSYTWIHIDWIWTRIYG